MQFNNRSVVVEIYYILVFVTVSYLMKKGHSFSGVKRVVDLCAAPGSWSQVVFVTCFLSYSESLCLVFRIYILMKAIVMIKWCCCLRQLFAGA